MNHDITTMTRHRLLIEDVTLFNSMSSNERELLNYCRTLLMKVFIHA